MNREILERSNQLVKSLDNAKLQLDWWKRATCYKKSAIDICSQGGCFNVEMFISFPTLQGMAIKHYCRKIERIEKEFEDLGCI